MAWLKKHAVALLAGLAAVLAGVMAWGSWKRRNGSLKDAVRVERARAASAGAQIRAEQAAADGRQLEHQDAALGKRIDEVRASSKSSRTEVEKLPDAQVVQKLNELYRRSPARRSVTRKAGDS